MGRIKVANRRMAFFLFVETNGKNNSRRAEIIMRGT
jgi:hypothetical protein